MTDGPLSGIRVVEWAHVHFGPGAGMFLGDMGAEVIHVEPREGDMMRHYRTLFGAEFLLDDGRRNTFTEDLLRNKRSLTLDLAKDEAREILLRLVDDADVFLTNYRPAAARRLRLDYETLAARNPRLVYAQGTSYGMEGPDRDAPGLEMMGLARGGLMLGSALPGGDPVYPTMGLNDRLGAIGLLVAVLTALLARERTGEAQFVETSLLGWTVNLQAVALSYTANVGKDIRPMPHDAQEDPNYSFYRLADGTWTALGMTVHPQKYWPLLCEALGHPELVDDPRFTTPESRQANHVELIAVWDDAFAKLTWEEWDAKIREHGLIACKVNALTELHEDEQITANGYLVKCPHPDLGEWWYAPTPLRLDKHTVGVRSPAPHIGEHTDEILGSLGYADDEIAALREREVV
jgi:crotonobetainyl-CoA:carnitine CoA-transferase CaiB-like acyl-CoA transferase